MITGKKIASEWKINKWLIIGYFDDVEWMIQPHDDLYTIKPERFPIAVLEHFLPIFCGQNAALEKINQMRLRTVKFK